MSDFMMSQVQGLLGKVSDDIDQMGRTTAAQTQMLLDAINDLAANMFATQAILCTLLRDYPVDPATVKAWVKSQTEAGGIEAPKTLAVIDMLLAGISKKQ
jgi:hypothetical protein